jgi:hypothetical protein
LVRVETSGAKSFFLDYRLDGNATGAAFIVEGGYSVA